jgi:hypothetical protein
MNESDARSALLVRAYETLPPAQTHGAWSEDDRAWATQAALQSVGEQASAAAFIGRRSRLAAERLCSRDGGARLVSDALTWRPWVGWALALAAFVAGIATDAIGPTRQINVLAPPLLALLAWNLVVYALLAARAAVHPGGNGAQLPGPLARLIARAAHSAASARSIERLTPVLASFARDWTVASAPLTASRVARILHTAAAAFAAGALLGMYLRGFALEYRAGWESTFLDVSAVHAILSIVLGPAAAISGIALPDVAGLAAIRSSASAGENAARWIHLYAVMVALLVLLPRALMALGRLLAERRLASRFPLALDDGYFQAIARSQRGAAAEIRIVPYSFRPSAQAARIARACIRLQDRGHCFAHGGIRRRRGARSEFVPGCARDARCRAVPADGNARARESRRVHRGARGAADTVDAVRGAGRRIRIQAALRRTWQRRRGQARRAARGLAAHACRDRACSGVRRPRGAGFRRRRARIARGDRPRAGAPGEGLTPCRRRSN